MKKSALLSLLLSAIVLGLCFTSCGGGQPAPPPAPTPNFSASPASINFGSQLVNPSGTQTQSVTITNTGSASLVISSVPAITGANAADFTLVSPPAAPITVAANSSLTLQVSFTPSSTGTRTASLTFTDNAAGNPHAVALAGKGTSPILTTNSPAVQFGTQAVGSRSTAKTVVVSNTGDGDLIISDITVAGTNSGDFALSGTAPLTVHPQGSAQLTVTFTPGASGARAGSLTLTDNASGSPHTVGLSGIGVSQGPAQAADASVVFNPNRLSATTFPTTLTVTIQGTDTAFAAGATEANFGPGAAVSDGNTTGLAGGFGLVQVTGPTTAIAQVTFDATAAPGPRFAIVSTGGHQSLATFVVPAHGVPVANAGMPQVVGVTKTAHLEGSGSSTQAAVVVSAAATVNASATTSPPPLTYQWTLLSAPDGSAASPVDASSVRPSFVVDQSGNYLIQLAVTDINGKTSAGWVLVSTTLTPPVANAGADQFVTAGATVQLDGSGSSNPAGNSLTYSWQFTAVPAGSAATLSNPNAVAPTFIADVAGDYLLQLTVNDGHGNTASDTVLISTQGTPPIASAGQPNQKVNVASQAQLDGSASHDPDGDTVTCSWALLAMPAASTAQVSNAGPIGCATKPTFTADQPGIYVAQLAVSDTKGNTTIATVALITPPGDPGPVAVAGPYQGVDTGATVNLDGSNSHDADGDPLTYTWLLLSKPNASAATLANASTATPTFVADVAGDYVCQLVVSDGIFTSVPSTVRVRAGSPGFSAAPTSITFPTQTINTTSNSSPIVITNTGAGTLQISNIAKGGTNPGDFAFTSAVLPVTVTGGASTTINVTFTPSAAGCTVSSCSRSATLTITHNAGPAATITLSGTGGVPVSQLSAVALNFGNQLVNTTSGPMTVTINNTGNGTLHISGLALSGTNKTEFAVTPATVPDVAPGSSTNLTVTFTPTATGSRSALLTITDNTTAGSETVTLSGTGTAPGVPTFNPAAPNFGNQLLGSTSAALPVTVTNPGTADLTISNVAISGANAGDFALTPVTTPITVHPSASTTLNLTFKPGAVGTRSGLLSLTDNAAGSPHSAALSGVGVISTISPSTVTFPGTIVGTTSSPLTVTLTNPSNASGDLTLNTVSVSGPNNAEFAASLAGSPTLPVVLHTGQSQQINITFTPAASGGNGSRSATLNITDSTGAYTVALSGTALGSTITLSPTSLDFGNQVVGTSSAAKPVLITNSGTANLHISSLSITGTNAADFSVPATAGIDIAPGLSVPVNVTFTPTAMGTRSAALSITDNATGSPHMVPLTGIGVAPVIGIAPSTLAFGNQTVNIASSPKQVTISNTGTSTLTISAITRSGANAGDFSFSPPAPLSVAPSAQTVLNVTFTPSLAALESASLDLTDNTTAGTHSIPLTGTGVVPGISLNPANGLNFGNQAVKTPSPPLTVTVTNNGLGTLLISSLTFTGVNLSDFSFPAGFTPPTQANPITVAAGGNVVLSVIFTPQTDTPEQATLNITSNASPPTVGVALSGTGVTPHMSISPSGTLAFGQQVVQTTSAPLAVTVTNTGAADLTVTGASITGTNASEFAVTTTTPITVAKNGGTGVINVTFTPAAAGARTATLTITGNAPESPQTLTLTGTGIVNGNLSLNSTSLGGNLETLAIGSVDVAPTSDLTVTITSSDPTKVLVEPVSTDPSGTSAGTASFTGTMKAKTNLTPGFWVQALATSGTPQITVSAPGYNPAVATVTLTPSGFQLNGPGGIGVDFTTTLGATPQLFVSVVQLDNAGNVLSTNQKLRGGVTANVTVNSGTPATGVIVGNPAVVQPATITSSAVTFQPKAAGTSVLSVTQPGGYLAPASGAQLTATVTAPGITLNPVTVGFNQQTLGVGHVNQAPLSPLTVTITSADATKVLLSTNPAAAGSASINLQVAAGTTALPAFYVQALGSSGVVTLTASASGYTNGSGNVAMTASAFLFVGSDGNPLPNFSTTTISGPTGLTVAIWQLDSSLHPLAQGQLRPGDSESVAVVSGTPSTGTIVGSPALFNGGDMSNTNLSFQPAQNCITPCTSVLSVTQPPGFSPPASGGQVTVTVNQPSVMPRLTQTTIGGNLEVSASGALDAPAPSNLQVTITSDNSKVLLATSPTAAGSQSIIVTVPAGGGVNSLGFPTYYVQAVNVNSGTAQLTTSAPGFASNSITVTLAPAGFVISGANGIGADVAATLGSNVTLTVNPVVLDANLAPTQPPLIQAIRGGLSPSVTVTSDSPAGVVLNSPVVIGSGTSSGSVTVNAASSGTATITVATPTGFTAPSSGAQLRVVVQ